MTGFFDNIDRPLLRSVIKHRVNDGGILRLIGKFLNAGIWDGKELSYPDRGTPQGAVISPMLANIFLHTVLDDWFVKEVQPSLRGRSMILRFADDFVIGCEYEEDARAALDMLKKRLSDYKLTVHPEKTKLINFQSPAVRGNHSQSKSGAFDFLGFKHYWAKSRRGYRVIKRRTSNKRLRRAQKRLWIWCRNNRHMKLKDQYRILCSKLRGHYQYYGIRCNYRSLEAVFELVERAWQYWLSRRSHKSYISWEKFEKLRSLFRLPKPRIIHSV